MRIYINSSVESLNLESTLKAITQAFCLIYFLIRMSRRRLPGSISSISLSNLFKSALDSSKDESLVSVFHTDLVGIFWTDVLCYERIVKMRFYKFYHHRYEKIGKLATNIHRSYQILIFRMTQGQMQYPPPEQKQG